MHNVGALYVHKHCTEERGEVGERSGASPRLVQLRQDRSSHRTRAIPAAALPVEAGGCYTAKYSHLDLLQHEHHMQPKRSLSLCHIHAGLPRASTWLQMDAGA